MYRIYLTDSAKEYLGLKMRWYDIVRPKPVETRTGDEIARSVISSAGLHFEGSEEE